MNRKLLGIALIAAAAVFLYLLSAGSARNSAPASGRNSALGTAAGTESAAYSAFDGSAQHEAAAYGRVYAAQNLTQQQRAASYLSGDAKFDSDLMSFHGAEICGYSRTNSASSLTAAARSSARLPKDAASLRSYQIVDQFRSAYCSGADSIVVDPEPDQVAVALVAASNAGSRNASTVLKALETFENGGAASDELKQSLVEVVRGTDSPALLIQALDLLSSDQAGGFAPPGFEFGVLDVNERILVAQFGAQLAACQGRGYCQVTNAYAVRMCMPASCSRGATVDQYIRNNLSPSSYEAARRYAEALMVLRNRSGRS